MLRAVPQKRALSSSNCIHFHLSYIWKKSETKLASEIRPVSKLVFYAQSTKQDQNTQKVKKNAYFNKTLEF